MPFRLGHFFLGHYRLFFWLAKASSKPISRMTKLAVNPTRLVTWNLERILTVSSLKSLWLHYLFNAALNAAALRLKVAQNFWHKGDII